MADVELVIKIPEELYNRFGYEYSEENLISKYTNDAILDAFCNGTPLPKGHGRLIDVDEVIKIANKKKDLHGAIWNAPTIIEADTEDTAERVMPKLENSEDAFHVGRMIGQMQRQLEIELSLEVDKNEEYEFVDLGNGMFERRYKAESEVAE